MKHRLRSASSPSDNQVGIILQHSPPEDNRSPSSYQKVYLTAAGTMGKSCAALSTTTKQCGLKQPIHEWSASLLARFLQMSREGPISHGCLRLRETRVMIRKPHSRAQAAPENVQNFEARQCGEGQNRASIAHAMEMASCLFAFRYNS